MEIKLLLRITLILTLSCCSNTSELETGEIKTLKLIKETFKKPSNSKQFIDARKLLSREQIDSAKIPVLFVELPSGQNGTLTKYPGQGVGQTWLGADGATITLEQGVLKASRGMGNDLMGSSYFTPPWSNPGNEITAYKRHVSYINGDNKISITVWECFMEKSNQKEKLKIWNVDFFVIKFEEHCNKNDIRIVNTYYLDKQNTVRKSIQYHSDTIGYITIERLDRL